MIVCVNGSLTMTVTKQELQRFHEFALSRISNGENEFTWRQLFELWRLDNPSAEEHAQDVAAIQESLDAMELGRMRPISEFDAEFRSRNGITNATTCVAASETA